MTNTVNINFHLGQIVRLKHSNDSESLSACGDHYKAVFDLTEDGDSSSAMSALKLAHEASLPSPNWAIDFFSSLINNHIDFPKVVLPDKADIEQIRTLRKRRNALSYAVMLLDAGVLKPSKFGRAKSLLATLNRYWLNGGSEGTTQNPFKI